MTMYRVGPAGIPASLKTNMDAVLNKKFGTSTTYAPATWPDNVNLLGPLPEKTASGSVASITDGADGVPLKNWGVTVAPTLSGVSAVSCSQGGKNLVDNSAAAWEGGNINTSGGNATGAGYVRTIGYYDIGGGMSYEISGIATPSQASDFRLFFYDETQTFISYKNYGSTPRETPANARYMRIRNVVGADMSTLQIEYGTTATAYEPYTASTVSTVNLGRTIYGGSVDVVAGTGIKTFGYASFKWGDYTATADLGSNTRRRFNLPSPVKMTDRAQSLCNVAPWLEEYSVDSTHFYVSNHSQTGDGLCNVFLPTGTSDDTDIIIVYTIATPEDFTFTPITPTPETALGTNNFWADEGDSDVTYRADINMLIASLSGNRGLMMTRPQLEEITEENKEEDPEVTEK